ncbi:MAG: hypothetical protein L3K02_04100 [Thermoplasmata archaeon]|nr:hypothetical protein [Thermoplasmata archaeon]
MRSRGPARVGPVVVFLVVVVSVGLSLAGLPAAEATTYPTLPLALDRWFVSNLTGAEVTPGGAGTITFTVGDPWTNASILSVVLTLQVYAFNAFPGNATSNVGVSAPPTLVTPTASGLSVNLSLGTIAADRSIGGSVAVQTSATTPSGAFAVRMALRFTAGGAGYLLESRGWFTASQWAAGTTGPNGTVDLNVSALGVSGVVPETSILVSSSNLSTAIYAVLIAGIALVGVAAWLYFRPPKSSWGVRNEPDETQAPRALGKSRTRDGD